MEKLFETERLIIRQFQKGDESDLFEYGQVDDVAKWCLFPTYKSIEDAKEFLKFVLSKYAKGEKTDFAVMLKESNKLIGGISLKPKNDLESFGIFKYINLGYLINPKFQKQGYASEALRGLIKHLKDYKEILNKDNLPLLALHDIKNEASGKVMQKAGMSYLKTINAENRDKEPSQSNIYRV